MLVVAGLQGLNPVEAHPASPAGACSTRLGFRTNRSKRGWAWGGASRAFTKASASLSRNHGQPLEILVERRAIEQEIPQGIEELEGMVR